jgi:hypothetical protein
VKLPVVIGAAAAAELRDHLARVAKDSPTTARGLNEERGWEPPLSADENQHI